MTGRAPILDFDGTLARLDVDWDGLRRRLGVSRIGDIWEADDPARGWAEVSAAETEAAATAQPIQPVLALIEDAPHFAILSSNSVAAIGAFLDRFPELRERASPVVGRETLEGPKSDFHVFERGYKRCLEAFAPAERVTYVGDQAYELDFAARLGAEVIDAKTLDGYEAMR
ncbi:MAG TPA: hypothetical protein VJS19_06165 [Candidatus Dormibacteraeota bacterium]|nr:hypothetical protein [Candidatus Dormibacteraeota bacterium]